MRTDAPLGLPDALEAEEGLADAVEVFFACAALGAVAAFAVLGRLVGALPGALFDAGGAGFLALAAAWVSSVLLWEAAATIVAETGVSGGFPRAALRILFWAAWAWPPAFSAALGHWARLAGTAALELLFAAAFRGTWFPQKF